MLDPEYRAQLEEQLRELRQIHHYDELHAAQRGISTEPYILIRMKQRAEQIAQIKALLGMADAPPPPRRQEYVAPARPAYRPEPDLRAQRGADVQHHVKMLGIHRGNLAHYTEQARAFGGVRFAPPVTRHGIEEAKEGVAREKRTLRGLGVSVDDFEGE
jgi:hypothetical protein